MSRNVKTRQGGRGHAVLNMVVRRWVDDVEYYEYAPTEVRYDPEQDAFTVARADIHGLDRQHHTTLAIVVNLREMSVERISLDTAIRQGRTILERLIEHYRDVLAPPTMNMCFLFNLNGRRVR
ncbi:MAG TPA: hypothetical protein VLG10_02790 [Methylomirabilota bacterium]|nr:hypothetical protein [Methylomirabilota bacterium]